MTTTKYGNGALAPRLCDICHRDHHDDDRDPPDPCRTTHAAACVCGNKPPAPVLAEVLEVSMEDTELCDICGCFGPAEISVPGPGPDPASGRLEVCLPHYVAGILAGEAP